jgi:autotransporter-associated beta strand protein
MTNSTWGTTPATNSYTSGVNWSQGLPTASDTAYFGNSTTTSLSINSSTQIGGWIFNPGFENYTFTVGATGSPTLDFIGFGILINGGSANIIIDPNGTISMENDSSLETASINNLGLISFDDGSSAGNANISNNHRIFFTDNSSAGSATIYTSSGAHTEFGFGFPHTCFSTGGNAQFLTDAGGIVDFSFSTGPANNHALSAGSLAGAGTYFLGDNQLTVGGNGFSRTVTGAIDDGGVGGGSGGSLVKIGHGTLTLAGAGNSYSGGTTIEQGTFDIAALGAAGSGAISFAAGVQKLRIENPALSGHVLGNAIDFFGKGDVIDLSGLHFHAGAHATYHATGHHLTVHSGAVTDTLTLISPHGMHFHALGDGHGGTEVMLLNL